LYACNKGVIDEEVQPDSPPPKNTQRCKAIDAIGFLAPWPAGAAMALSPVSGRAECAAAASSLQMAPLTAQRNDDRMYKTCIQVHAEERA